MEGDHIHFATGELFPVISIHSLRMEGDRLGCGYGSGKTIYFNPLPPHGGRPEVREKPRTQKYFNPLPPHGGRQQAATAAGESITFQSTPSAWRETGQDHGTRLCRSISIHSLRMEGDYIDLGYLCGGVYFNPLPPHGGRQDKLPVEANFENISIHSLRMEGDTLIWLTEILQ